MHKKIVIIENLDILLTLKLINIYIYKIRSVNLP